MPDKIMDVLYRLCKEYRYHDGVGCSEDFNKAHSQILEIFKEMLPKERESLHLKSISEDGGTYINTKTAGYNLALQNIRAKIMALTNNGGSDDPKE